MNTKSIISETDEYYLPVFTRYQLAFTHGKGCKLYDADGDEYLDFLAGIAVNSLGHAHPAVVKAISEQAGKLMHCSNIYYTDVQARAVKLISEATGFDRVFLANSGAEGNEGAIKLARKYGHSKNDGKYRIITATHSFHGRTMMTVTATGQPKYQQGYEPLPAGFDYVPYGDIAALTDAMDEDVCCVMLEPIQGEGGVHVPADEYLQQARALCDKYDALLIFDEIQTGVARTGAWFAYMHSGVKPDILTFAKGIGGGFPVGGFCVDEKLAHVFKPGDHGGTFGGNALACSAIEAVLTVIKEEKIVEQVAEKGQYFKEKLFELKAKYPEKIAEVRGRGLILGMELTKPGAPLVAHCLSNHVIINCTAGNVIRLVPPLIVTKQEIDTALAAIEAALAEF